MPALRPTADIDAGLSALLVLDPKRTSLTLRETLIKIGAKVVRHGRWFTFQLAEVTIPRCLFTKILRRIGDPRPRPAPA